jgi:hypothetical protein
MKNFLLTVFISLSALSSMAAQPYEIWWKRANDFYIQKQFDSAVYYYEKITALSSDNEVVYYNLCNAYYRINRIGPAVLNYEKALHINPNYKEAKDNLAITQSRIANRIPIVPDIFFVSWWNTLTQASKTSAWTIGGIIIFIIILILVWMKRIKRKNIPQQLTGFLWLCWVVFICLAFFSAKNVNDSESAVVMQNDAPLLSAVQGKTQSLVPEGTTVQLKEVNGGWVEVRLPDGRKGWMQLSLLSKI